jgi:hypothetical protein
MWQRDEDDLAALAAFRQDAVAVFLAQVGDAHPARLQHSQAKQGQQRDEGEVGRVGRQPRRVVISAPATSCSQRTLRSMSNRTATSGSRSWSTASAGRSAGRSRRAAGPRRGRAQVGGHRGEPDTIGRHMHLGTGSRERRHKSPCVTEAVNASTHGAA